MIAPVCHAVEVERSYDQDYGEIRLSTAVPGCRLEWIIHEREVNRGLIKHHPDCDLPLADQQPMLAALLTAALAEPVLSDGIAGFFFGRLNDSFELSRRLSLAAWRARDWDHRRGKPHDGGENRFVAQLVERESLYPELAGVFASQGLRLRFSAAEKVLVMPAGDLPMAAWLRGQGVPDTARVPFDCMAWFEVARAQGP